jgi:hypothetical protein
MTSGNRYANDVHRNSMTVLRAGITREKARPRNHLSRDT